MTPEEVGAAVREGALVIDLRPPRPFSSGHLPGAVNIQFNRADLAERMQMVLPKEQRLLLHSEPDAIANSAQEILSLAGFRVDGIVSGGIRAWAAAGLALEALPVIDVDQLHEHLEDFTVIDAREAFEFRHGHIPAAQMMSSMEAWTAVADLPADGHFAVVCGDQVRSALVSSIMRPRGLDATLVMGGMTDWIERNYALDRVPPKAAGGRSMSDGSSLI